MPELNNESVKLSYWLVKTQDSEYRLSDREMDLLMVAESKGIRLVMFDGFVLNTSYIKEANHIDKVKKLDMYNRLDPELEKFIVVDKPRLQ